MATSSDKPPITEKFRIAIIGSGPIAKLLACSVTPHPRIEYAQFESDALPLRPSFGYGIGPQTLRAAKLLNGKFGKDLEDTCILSEIWQDLYHGGDEDRLIEAVRIPSGGLYGRIGRQELLDLLDLHTPEGHETRYEKRLSDIRKTGENLVELVFDDHTKESANAVWACDGINSLCRKFVQTNKYKKANYAGMVAYRGKVPAARVVEELGDDFVKESYLFIGVEGWHLLENPIENGQWINIAAFAVESERIRKGRDHVITVEEVLDHFPGRSEKVDTLLKLVGKTPGGPRRLELTTLDKLEAFYNTGPCITSFGDAASGMLPRLAASMSIGFIGVATFLREGLNPLLERLSVDATNAEIADLIMEASALYDVEHQPLAQRFLDLTNEQGHLWSGGVIAVEELTKRPKLLRSCADHLR